MPAVPIQARNHKSTSPSILHKSRAFKHHIDKILDNNGVSTSDIHHRIYGSKQRGLFAEMKKEHTRDPAVSFPDTHFLLQSNMAARQCIELLNQNNQLKEQVNILQSESKRQVLEQERLRRLVALLQRDKEEMRRKLHRHEIEKVKTKLATVLFKYCQLPNQSKAFRFWKGHASHLEVDEMTPVQKQEAQMKAFIMLESSLRRKEIFGSFEIWKSQIFYTNVQNSNTMCAE